MAGFSIAELIQSVDALNIDIPVNQVFFEDKIQSGKNEFLFFMKPEILIADDPNLKRDEIIAFIFSKIAEFGLQIKNIRILNASYLAKFNIIGQHYGVINRISSDVKNRVSQGGKDTFEDLFKEPFDRSQVYGSLQFLNEFPVFNAVSLDYLWQNSKFQKLSGGTYCAEIYIDGKKVFLVNGFHPRQLEHFTLPDRSIVIFTLSGNISWNEARNSFIGVTNPEKALPGSIRRELSDRKKEFGLKTVSSSWNGVHHSNLN